MEDIERGECETDLSLEDLSTRFIEKIVKGENVMSNGSLVHIEDLWKIKIFKSEESIEQFVKEEESKRKGEKKSFMSFLKASPTWEAIEKCEEITNEILKAPPKQSKKSEELYVAEERITQLEAITSATFDLTRLIQYLREINSNYKDDSLYSTAMLLRATIDHVPPIFGKNSFGDVANQYGAKSFKDSMIHLDKGLRKISDSYLHSHIRRKEVIPVKQQVEFRAQIDVLISEIIVILT